MLLEETYNFLKTNYKELTESLTIADVRIGAHLSAVRLSDNSYGVASTLVDSVYHQIKKDRYYGDFSPLQITGHKITTLFETDKKSAIINTLRVAVLNAISSTHIAKGNYRIIENTDPVDLLDTSKIKTVTIVGAFHSYLQKMEAAGKELFVLELDETALTEEYRRYYIPADEYSLVFPKSDAVIITGLTLVNSTIDGLLAAIKPGADVIVTGPSGSIIPEILFRHNVTIVGATRIHDPDKLFSVVGECGAGYHLFRYCATKICILNEQIPGN